MKRVISLSSTQIAEFLRCPQLWNLHSAQLWGKPEDPFAEEHATDKGAIVHAALAKHYRKDPLDWKFEGDDLKAWKKLTPETRTLVKNRVVQYIFTRGANDFIPKSREHVEMGFSTPIYEDDSHIYVVEGRIDLITRDNVIVDHKTQSRYAVLYDHRVQFVTYAMATGIRFFVTNYIMLAEKVDEHTFRTSLASFTVDELEYWRQYLITNVFQKIARWEIEKNHGACGGTYDSWPCMFNKVCWTPNEARAAAMLHQNFVHIEPRRSW